MDDLVVSGELQVTFGRRFEEKAAQQITGDCDPIVGTRAPDGNWLVLILENARRLGRDLLAPSLADQKLFAMARPQRRRGHAAEADPRRGNLPRPGNAVERQMERAAQAGNI